MDDWILAVNASPKNGLKTIMRKSTIDLFSFLNARWSSRALTLVVEAAVAVQDGALAGVEQVQDGQAQADARQDLVGIPPVDLIRDGLRPVACKVARLDPHRVLLSLVSSPVGTFADTRRDSHAGWRT